MTIDRTGRVIAYALAVLLVAAPTQAQEDDASSTGGTSEADDGEGEGGTNHTLMTTGQWLGDWAVSTAMATGPCELVVYDPSDPGTFLIDPDGCVWSLLDEVPGE